MQKVLVTGSSGLLGGVIVRQLQHLGYNVIGIDKIPADTTNLEVDITDKKACLTITHQVDAIIHIAALHGKHYELNYPRAPFIDVNVHGTLNLLEACVKNNISQFIYTSTTSVYGNAMVNPNHAVWVTEDLMPQPRDIYDYSKLMAESLCRDFALKEQIHTTVLRISRFYREEPRLIAINRMYRGLSVDDGATAHIMAMKSNKPGYNLYNLSFDSPFQIRDLQGLMKDPKSVILKYYPGLEADFQKNNWEFPNLIDRVYVIEKIKSELGFMPQEDILTYLSQLR